MAVIDPIDRRVAQNSQSKRKEEVDRRLRAAQESYSRRKKVRKRSPVGWKWRKSSIGVSLEVEGWRKAATKLLSPGKEGLRKWSKRKGGTCRSLSGVKLVLVPLRRGGLRANKASEGDKSVIGREKGVYQLRFLIRKGRNDYKSAIVSEKRSLIGQFRRGDVPRKGGEGARSTRGVKMMYDLFRFSGRRGWSVVMELGLHFRPDEGIWCNIMVLAKGQGSVEHPSNSHVFLGSNQRYGSVWEFYFPLSI